MAQREHQGFLREEPPAGRSIGPLVVAPAEGALAPGSATEATLQNVRSEQFRRTDPLAAGSNLIGFVSPSTSQKVGQGRFMLAGSGRLQLSVAGNIRMTFTNPSTSARNISIVRIAGQGTAQGWATILINPTTGLPATGNRPVLNAVVGGGAPALGEVRADTSATVALGGGTDTGIVLGLPPNRRSQIDLPPLVIAPGVVLGINIPFTGTADAAMSIYWIEDPTA